MMDWLLGLQDSAFSWGESAIGLARPIPPWAWLLALVVAVVLAGWSYSRLEGGRRMRLALAGLRATLLLVLLLLIAGPQLVNERETVEKDWVVVMVDRSASLSILDAPPPEVADGSPGVGTGARTTREAQLRAVLAGASETLAALAKERTLLVVGFDANAYELDVEGGIAELGEASGRGTSLRSAFNLAMSRTAARPLAGVVVISDGRSADQPDASALRRLVAQDVPVYGVALGSDEPLGDIAIRGIDAPRVAYVGDITPVRVTLESLGAGAPPSVRVRLVDTSTGLVLDEQDAELVRDAQGLTTVVLTTTTREAISADWSVELVMDRPDLVPANDSAGVSLSFVDRPIRVLYVDGYPRWEQRYLKNLLLRESSVNSSNLIRSPDRRFIEDSNTTIADLPTSPEEWSEIDTIVLGDVDPRVFTTEQLEQIRDHVALSGGGLMWLGGQGSIPSQWYDTPLADLLPFGKSVGEAAAIPGSILMAPTPSASSLGVLQLASPDEAGEGWPPELADESTGWSLLRYAQRLPMESLKPTAQVLAMARPVLGGEETPVVLLMRYGAGRSLYVATDEIWRWRFGRGEKLIERFWIQLVRMLGRERLSRTGQAAVLTASPAQVLVGQPVRVALRLFDQDLVDRDLPSVSVELVLEASGSLGGAEERSVSLVLDREASPTASSEAAQQLAGTSYAAIWQPDEPGSWGVRVDDPALAGTELEASVEVLLPDDELRQPESDHPALAALAEQTGGRLLTASELNELPSLLPNRENRRQFQEAEPLWDSPLTLVVVLVLLTLEWVGRRVVRLI